MPNAPLTVWCNATLPQPVLARVAASIGDSRWVVSTAKTGNLEAGKPDPTFADADVALGQPPVDQMLDHPKLRWAQLTSAGYDRYDRPDLRQRFAENGSILTNSSSVYDDPCAQHAFAMMMALARELPQQLAAQLHDRSWRTGPFRVKQFLLTGQNVTLLGYGAIARRLIELLAPFRMKITALRRKADGGESVKIIGIDGLNAALAEADHVVAALPGGEPTKHLMNAERFGAMKRGSMFYNIGRGTSVDQFALLSALRSGHLAGAYLDVTSPEPLPPDHALWTAPNCFITPHTAGGHRDEFDRLASHFLANFERFRAGQPLADRVI